MISGYTVFFSYMLANEPVVGYTGYSSAIHCNYINKVYLENLINKDVNIYFNDINDFNFLTTSGGTGYHANKIYMVIQLVENAPFDSLEEVKPESDKWKKFDVTDQITDYVSGQRISPLDLVSAVFKVPLSIYDSGDTYNLNYLNYPDVNNVDDLCFGSEEVFLGNIETDIEASVYTTDLSINLPLNQFNSTTNKTWDNLSEVYITEVALYNENKEMVAIGKFNNPIKKDSTISRTIEFNIDF